jgi:polyhydroxybutyrate depolymerase
MTTARTAVTRTGWIMVTVVSVALATSCSTTTTARRAASPSGSGASASSATADARGPSAGCKVPATRPGTTDKTILSGTKARAYQLDVPEGYDGTRPYALVFGLHSLTVDFRIVPALSGFADMHKKYRFIGVSPSGLLNGNTPYWNAAPVADNYDVTFITALLDHLEKTMCIDTARVFSVGMSNGAQMTSL